MIAPMLEQKVGLELFLINKTKDWFNYWTTVTSMLLTSGKTGFDVSW
jgi:hypothetical protein